MTGLRDSREAIAGRASLKETGATLVPPFDHPLIMAGQGTAALELLEDAPTAGRPDRPGGRRRAALRLRDHGRDMNPDIRIFGAEPEGANDTFLSFLAGERVAVRQSRYHRRRPALTQAGGTDIPGAEAPGRANHAGDATTNCAPR